MIAAFRRFFEVRDYVCVQAIAALRQENMMILERVVEIQKRMCEF
jgi:hypothetical protein